MALLFLDQARPPERQLVTRGVAAGIRLYRSAMPRGLAPRCRFRPTCSEYALEVVERHGALRGGLLTVGRLLRCGPWTPAGTVDPPP